MIHFLIAVHPRSWKARYGEELRELLESSPVTAAVVLDVLRNALVQQVRAHAALLRFAAALAVTAVVEVVAVRAQLSENVLWLPSSPTRAAALAVVLAPWFPVAMDARRAVRRRRCSAAVS